MATMCKHGDNSPHHRRNSREEDVTHQTSDHAGTLENRSSIRTEKHFIYFFSKLKEKLLNNLETIFLFKVTAPI